MKPFIHRALFTLAFSLGFAATLAAQQPVADKGHTVTTEGVFSANATHSGYAINGYYVELTKEQAEAYKGKRVSVTGRMIEVKGMNPGAPEGQTGSTETRKFIREPKITVLK